MQDGRIDEGKIRHMRRAKRSLLPRAIDVDPLTQQLSSDPSSASSSSNSGSSPSSSSTKSNDDSAASSGSDSSTSGTDTSSHSPQQSGLASSSSSSPSSNDASTGSSTSDQGGLSDTSDDSSSTSNQSDTANASGSNTSTPSDTSNSQAGSGDGGKAAPSTTTATRAQATPTATSTATTSTASTPTTTAATTTAKAAKPITPTVTSEVPVVIVTSTSPPTAAATQGALAAGSTGEGSTPNIGAIIGGIAGGLVGLILLLWLILIPVRAHAKRKRDIDWLSFKPDSHNTDEDGAQSIFRTPRAGVGEEDEDPGKAGVGMHSPQSFQMHEVGPGIGMQGGTTMQSLYGHLDGVGETSPERQHAIFYGSTAYGVPGHPMQDASQYAAYYPAGQHMHNASAAYVHISPQASPEMNAVRYQNNRSPDQIVNSTQNLLYTSPTVEPVNYPSYGIAQSAPAAPIIPQYNPSQSVPPSASSQPLQARPSQRSQETYGDQSLQRRGTDTATLFSHTGHAMTTDEPKGFATYGGGTAASAVGVGETGTMHHRRESKGELDKSEDVCLPYERSCHSESPRLYESNNLHLVNPDN